MKVKCARCGREFTPPQEAPKEEEGDWYCPSCSEELEEEEDGSDFRMWLNVRVEKNFKLAEFACKCCHKVYLHSDLVDKLQRIRDHFGRPLIIISGYRCPRHNRRVGGAPRSYHLRGKAADIRIPGVDLKSLANFCALVGFKGIKAYYNRGFIHVDLRTWRWHRF